MRLPGILTLCWMASLSGCAEENPQSARALLSELIRCCAARDIGALMNSVDLNYEDDLGGASRLEDDLRQLFTVYGTLALTLQDVSQSEAEIKGHARVEGRNLRYEGPLRLSLSRFPAGPLLHSGVLTDLRGIIHSLRERRIALETGIPERLQRWISVQYQGPLGGKEAVIGRLREDLAVVQAQAFMAEDVNIQVSDKEAQVVQSFLLITRVGERRQESRDRERLTLRKEGLGWFFVGGLG